MKITKLHEKTRLEQEIDNIHDKLNIDGMNPIEYTAMSEHLLRLYEAKNKETSRRISPDAVAAIAGNLLGIALILKYEKLDIITSKAISFIIKGRV